MIHIFLYHIHFSNKNIACHQRSTFVLFFYISAPSRHFPPFKKKKTSVPSASDRHFRRWHALRYRTPGGRLPLLDSRPMWSPGTAPAQLCVCVCVCVYSVGRGGRRWTNTYSAQYIYIYMYVCIYIHIYTCVICIYIYMFMCIQYTHTHTHTHTRYTSSAQCLRMCVCVCVCICVCACLCVCEYLYPKSAPWWSSRRRWCCTSWIPLHRRHSILPLIHSTWCDIGHSTVCCLRSLFF
jgi:hypothetical protein